MDTCHHVSVPSFQLSATEAPSIPDSQSVASPQSFSITAEVKESNWSLQ